MNRITENEWMKQADSRETSPEIMEAICACHGGSRTPDAIWNAPTETALLAIRERATKNGTTDAEDLCWGSAGSDWFRSDDTFESDWDGEDLS